MHAGDIATWVGAIATFLAVLVALRLHLKIYPPFLHLRLLNSEGRDTPVTVQSIENGVVTGSRTEMARYYAIELVNLRPLIHATNPHVYILSVERPDASGEFQEVWAGAIPSVATYYGVHPSRTLGSDPQLYDLCSVVRGKWIQLFPQIVTNNFPQYTRPDGKTVKLRITLQARSLEAVSKRYRFEIAWDGEWADGALEMRRHMVVRQA